MNSALRKAWRTTSRVGEGTLVTVRLPVGAEPGGDAAGPVEAGSA